MVAWHNVCDSAMRRFWLAQGRQKLPNKGLVTKVELNFIPRIIPKDCSFAALYCQHGHCRSMSSVVKNSVTITNSPCVGRPVAGSLALEVRTLQ